MTRLNWNNESDLNYSSGVDRGCLDGSEVWNGLISVEETTIGRDRDEYYFNGVKSLNVVGDGFYQAKASTYYIPSHVRRALGYDQIIPGVYLTAQPKTVTFDFSYRSNVGSNGYLLHFIYNIRPTQSNTSHQTLSDGSSVSVFEITLDATPPDSSVYRPTAHIVIDSSRISSDALNTIEDYLYGTFSTLGAFPSQTDLISMVS